MMNPWDDVYPWLNSPSYARVPYSTKLYLYRSLQARTVEQRYVESYNWGDLFAGIGDFVDYLKRAFGVVLPPREVEFQKVVEETSLRDLSQIENQVAEALRTRKPLTIKGVNYSLADLQKFVKPSIDAIQKNLVDVAIEKYETDALTKAADKKKLEERLTAADQSVRDAEYTFQSIKDVFESNPTPQYETLYRKAALELQTKQETLARLQAAPQYRQRGTQATPTVATPPATTARTTAAQPPAAERAGTATTTPTTPVARTLTGEAAAAEQRMRTEAFAGRVPGAPTPTPTPVGGSGVGGPSAPAAPVTVTRADVNAGLAAKGLADTPANRKLVREELKAGKTAAAPMANWEDEVRRQYTKYAWMLDDLDRAKYKDVFDLLQEAVNPQTKITDPNVFLARFEGTSWYQELATAQMGRKLRDQVGALSFDSGNYAKLLNNAMRMGWEGDVLKAEAYREVFRRNTDGTYANPNAIGEARASSDFLAIKRIGSAYLTPMSDDRVIETLTGGTTRDDLLRIYREKAKVDNPHLAAAIDAGVTLEDFAYDYRRAAAEVLEKPVDAIPMSADFIGQALKTGEAGKYRTMSLNEWKTMLKSDDQYGWQFTNQARDQATNLVMEMEKAFGFRA